MTMTIVLKVTWTALVLTAVVALSIGLSKANNFGLGLEARIDLTRGRQTVLVASAALIAMGVAAIPMFKAPPWTVILVIVMACVSVWFVYSDWVTLVALAVVYPLSVIVIAGYWVPRTSTSE